MGKERRQFSYLLEQCIESSVSSWSLMDMTQAMSCYVLPFFHTQDENTNGHDVGYQGVGYNPTVEGNHPKVQLAERSRA